MAYIRRCITIGYCQGFNYIARKILKITNDEVYNILFFYQEETFWIFTEIIERLLPLNYFTELVGLMTDFTLIKDLIINNNEKLYLKNLKCDF